MSSKARAVTRNKVPRRWKNDLDVLRRIIDRTKIINDPRNVHFSAKNYKKFPSFRIATISTSINEEDLVPIERRKQGYKVWVVADTTVRERLRREFLRHLRTAGEGKARFVCFNELAYPTPLDKAEDEGFREEVRKLVNRFGFFLVAGSYHDSRRYYNICPLFSPLPVQSDDVHGDADVLSHAKLTSAVRAFEYIRIPPSRQLRYYETSYGDFGILICIDVYDPALVLRLMKKNHPHAQEKSIDVMFIPSFSPRSMAEACKDLSYATASLVVYVNCATGEGPRHAIFLAGEQLGKGTTTRGYRRRELSPNVVLHELTYNAYHERRTALSDLYSPVFEYLIGQKQGVRLELNL